MKIEIRNNNIEIKTVDNGTKTFFLDNEYDFFNFLIYIKNSSLFDIEHISTYNKRKIIYLITSNFDKLENKIRLDLTHNMGYNSIDYDYKELINYLRANSLNICYYCNNITLEQKQLNFNEVITILKNNSEYENITFEDISTIYDKSEPFMCSNCYEKIINELIFEASEYYCSYDIEELIYSYHSSNIKDLTLKNDKNIKFGVEIEFGLCGSDYELYNTLKELKELNLINIESDCSLNGAYCFELVSNILDLETLNKYEHDFIRLFNNLNKFSDLDYSHGGHMHISRALYDSETIKRAFNFFIDNEELLKEISERFINDYDSETVWEYASFNNLEYDYIYSSKYSPINLTDNTIEFRFWGAYTSLSDIYNRYFISVGILELAKHDKLTLSNLVNYLDSILLNPILKTYNSLNYYIDTIRDYL